MPLEPCAALRRELFLHLLDSWLSAVPHQSRRATLAQVYHGDAGAASASLRLLADRAASLRRGRLTVPVLSASADDLAVRLGVAEVGLPAEIDVHPVTGGVDRLPPVLRAAGAAGAPLHVHLDLTGTTAPDAALLAAINRAGRPTEVLIVADTAARPAAEHDRLLRAAGFPLVTVVEVARADQADVSGTEAASRHGQLVIFGTAFDRRLAAAKEALWHAGTVTGALGREPDDPSGRWRNLAGPDVEPLRRRLLARLVETGPCPVSELRRFTAESTLHRPADTGPALDALLADGLLIRTPANGRLSGEVMISPARAGSAS